MIRRTITGFICALSLYGLASCDDPDNLYGKRKDMQILDENGEQVTQTYVSLISTGVLDIVGGMGDNHTIYVEDESVLTADYSHRGAGDSFITTVTYPASVIIFPQKLGSTVISITDEDTDETLHVRVDVVHQYNGLTVTESTVEELKDGLKICFLQDEEINEYRIVTQNDKEYISEEKGEYHFEWEDFDVSGNQLVPGNIYVTLRTSDKETVWKITDADNNLDGHPYYASDIFSGLGLETAVTTKFEPALNFPELFLFTDAEDPERHFMTGRAEVIKYTFE